MSRTENIHEIGVSLNHGNIEWLGLEGAINSIYFQPLAMGRDIFYDTRLFKAPSSLALNTPRDGAFTIKGEIKGELVKLVKITNAVMRH